MSGFTTGSNEHLIRSQIWSTDLKEVFEEDLVAMKYIRLLTDFPDGNLINIPSIGQAEVTDYAENRPVTYTAFDTGNFQFTISDYKVSATYITRKMMQDTFYMSELVSSFVPKQHRAIAKQMEVDALKIGPNSQTASNLNTINGGNHRFIGSGTNETIAIKDFALATYALEQVNLGGRNKIAIVDPSVEYTLKTQANLVALDNNKSWEGVVRDDMVTGTKFSFNIFGWDVYTSVNLKKSVNETINGRTSGAGVANLFFIADGDATPFIGLVRQAPIVDSEWNKDYQREEYVTTARYGFGLYRPESLVTIITDTDQVV